MAHCWSCCVAGVQGALHRALLKKEITCLFGSTSMGGTGTSGALTAVPRECGDFRGASSSLDGLRGSSLGGASA